MDSAKNATCTTTGLTEGTHCSVCLSTITKQETIPALGHTEETLPTVAPTCTETGLTSGTKCSVCGTVLVAQEIVPANGHTEVTDNAIEATCTTDGMTEGKHCDVCQTVTVPQETIPAVGHTEETLPSVDPTCSQTGLTEGTKCSVCGEILVVQTEVSTIEHNFTSYTSNNNGTHQSNCSSCIQSYNESCEIVGGKCKACGYSPKTFSVYNAGVVSVENGTYTTNYAIEPSANNDDLYGTLSSAGTVVYKLNANLDNLNFNIYFPDGETNGSTIYLDLNGCSISGTLSLSAKNFNLYVFDSSETKGTIDNIVVSGSGQLFIWDVEISNNNIMRGISSNGVNVTMYSGSIHDCNGGISVSNANVNIYGGEIYNNFADNGAGIFVSNGVVTIHNGEIYNNYAYNDGGGVCVQDNQDQDAFVMSGGYIYHNKAVNGGGIYVKGNIVINGGTISGNIAQETNTIGTGGGIYHSNGTLTIDGGTIGGANPYVQDGDAKAMANSAKAFGAEIYSNGIINFTNGTMYLHDYGKPYSIACYYNFNYKGGSLVCEQDYWDYISFL